MNLPLKKGTSIQTQYQTTQIVAFDSCPNYEYETLVQYIQR